MQYREHIDAGSGYDVTVGAGLLSDCGKIAAGVKAPCKAVIITDSNVGKLYLETVRKSFYDAGFEVFSFIFPAGESSKNMNTVLEILGFMADCGFTRGDLAIALGGGVTGDITGFAAGIYMRGIDYIQLPTTLLAAVDSSVGGKTAADLPQGKNLAGVFIQPKAVICDTKCLETLNAETLSDGMAEAIKAGILSGEELFSLAQTGDDTAKLIALCVKYKGGVVSRDEFEKGERKLLNLGHTIGHAIEKLSGYTVTHGRAVAAGTAIITRAAVKSGTCSEDDCKRIIKTLQKYSLPTDTCYTAQQLAEAALADKKRSGDEITIILPEKIGKCKLKAIPVRELADIIASGMEA